MNSDPAHTISPGNTSQAAICAGAANHAYAKMLLATATTDSALAGLQRARTTKLVQATNVVLSDIHYLSFPAPIKSLISSRSEQVCLASSDLLHTHLALAGTRVQLSCSSLVEAV